MIIFFQCVVKLGRHIDLNNSRKHSMLDAYWNGQGISDHFSSKFWGRIWIKPNAQRISTFQWLLVRNRFLVDI